MPEPILRLEGVNTYYGMVHALKGISMEIGKGEIVALIGSNGAGKTTTMHTISGILKPKQGKIVYDGKDITQCSPSEIVKLGICLSPEGREVFPDLTVQDNLKLGAFTRKDRAKIAEDYDKVYGLFPRLFERKTQVAKTLSGGEQQMLAIGRALMGDPQVLLLDEPSLGLSPNLVMLIFDLVKDIKKLGVTILLVEQNAKMALKTADRAYVLETGRITLSGTGSDLLTDDNVRKAYLGNIQ
jgi:branched-chain amino acid transport system ATP-binding protein